MTKPELPHYGNGVPAIVVQLKGKHCRKPHWRNGVVDTFRHKHPAVKASAEFKRKLACWLEHLCIKFETDGAYW